MIIESQADQTDPNSASNNEEKITIEKYTYHILFIIFFIFGLSCVIVASVGQALDDPGIFLLFLIFGVFSLIFAIVYLIYPSLFIVECVPSQRIFTYSVYICYKCCHLKFKLYGGKYSFEEIVNVVPYNTCQRHGIVFSFTNHEMKLTELCFKYDEVNNFCDRTRPILFGENNNNNNNNAFVVYSQQPTNVQMQTVVTENQI